MGLSRWAMRCRAGWRMAATGSRRFAAALRVTGRRPRQGVLPWPYGQAYGHGPLPRRSVAMEAGRPWGGSRCRPDFELEVVDEPVPGVAGRLGLHLARNDAPHRAARDALGPSAMPNAPAAAAQDRRRGYPKYPHRGGAAVQRLPRPGGVPTPGASADRRIASFRAAASTRTTSNPVPERRVALRTTRAARKTLKCPCPPPQTEPPGRQPPTDLSKTLRRKPNNAPENKIATFMQHAG